MSDVLYPSMTLLSSTHHVRFDFTYCLWLHVKSNTLPYMYEDISLPSQIMLWFTDTFWLFYNHYNTIYFTSFFIKPPQKVRKVFSGVVKVHDASGLKSALREWNSMWKTDFSFYTTKIGSDKCKLKLWWIVASFRRSQAFIVSKQIDFQRFTFDQFPVHRFSAYVFPPFPNNFPNPKYHF